jgi:nucleoside-diphosphate-sugar epimerase
VLVTGAEGVIGTAVRDRLRDRYDIVSLTREPVAFPSHVADIADLAQIAPAFEGVDSVVHLAAAASVDSGWDDVLRDNVVGARNVFEASRRAAVGAVVFASSNHAVGGWESEHAPSLYALDDPRRLDERAELRPDSLYGVSKAFGEALGRYYAETFGMRVVCLRIGTVRADDDPCASARPERLRATWLSKRDCCELIACALEAEGARFAIVYGTSDNPRQIWSLDGARALGYAPRDAAPVEC